MSSCQCQICLGDLFAMDVSALSCGHIFHRDCAVKWRTVKATCPTCKQVPSSIVPTLYFNVGEDDNIEEDIKNGVSTRQESFMSVYMGISLKREFLISDCVLLIEQ